ncbi:MAG: hydrogenase maturation nickel metallochaperone HypA [Acidobacteria bacterium]|nr:hydrogenase maturation nickel metallochaperone HypA [Acidobacteriota bacterium]
MHELSIAKSVLEGVRAELARRPGARLQKVGLRVGELSGVNADALSFSFEALVKGTEMESVTLEIERGPRRQRCPDCMNEFAVENGDLACPSCGARVTECIGGRELEFTYLEFEEP